MGCLLAACQAFVHIVGAASCRLRGGRLCRLQRGYAPMPSFPRRHRRGGILPPATQRRACRTFNDNEKIMWVGWIPACAGAGSAACNATTRLSYLQRQRKNNVGGLDSRVRGNDGILQSLSPCGRGIKGEGVVFRCVAFPSLPASLPQGERGKEHDVDTPADGEGGRNEGINVGGRAGFPPTRE